LKVSGFTFIRNAIKYDYPIVEAISSILPLCDEVIVNVGKSEDGTEELIAGIESAKIKICHSVWDESLKEGGRVLAAETDKAFSYVANDADWCIYIQGDEIIHEKYYDVLRGAMEKYKDDKNVEGLLFKYLHFYGSYDYVGDSRTWYSHEIRVIRNDRNIRSYRDAQGFRKNNEKLKVKLIDACIYHYGWVRHPQQQLSKHLNFEQLYNLNKLAEKISREQTDKFDYSTIDSLQKFTGTHPLVMKQRIEKRNWSFDFDISKKNFNTKQKVLYWIEKKTGKRLFDYRNYKIIR
jgi:hypothetical protein